MFKKKFFLLYNTGDHEPKKDLKNNRKLTGQYQSMIKYPWSCGDFLWHICNERHLWATFHQSSEKLWGEVRLRNIESGKFRAYPGAGSRRGAWGEGFKNFITTLAFNAS